MMWFRKNRQQKVPVQRPVMASRDEKRAVFRDSHDHLFWTAILITGSRDSAERAVVTASQSPEQAKPVFQNWLVQWAIAATARAAIDEVRDQTSATSSHYAQIACTHGYHEPFTADQIETLRRLPLKVVHDQLDPFARSVLVLHGVHKHSIAACARSLAVPPEHVSAAYCRVTQWREGLTLPAVRHDFEAEGISGHERRESQAHLTGRGKVLS